VRWLIGRNEKFFPINIGVLVVLLISKNGRPHCTFAPMAKLQIAIVGTGNSAWHFTKRLLSWGGAEIWSSSRFIESAEAFQKQTGSHHTSTIENLPKTLDLYILAVADNAVPEVAATLGEVEGLVVHTSGFVAMDVLYMHERRGVLYPLQTLTKGVDCAPENLPLLVESHHKKDEQLLVKWAQAWVPTVQVLNSAQRRQLHAAAVFANNFTNHLLYKAQQICAMAGLPAQTLDPLVAETFRKAQEIGPLAAQTGPAKRGDQRTMMGHQDLLNPNDAALYEALSKSIQNLYEREL
jgi:predicted short-subunit dehydrogenase-like oxidoreductase (DUF2520 family)